MPSVANTDQIDINDTATGSDLENLTEPVVPDIDVATDGVDGVFGVVSQMGTIEIINRIVAYAILLTGLLSVIFIIKGGIAFIISGGQEDKIKTSTDTIRHSIIGLVISILAVVFVSTVGKTFGFEFIRYIDFKDVVQFIQNIGEKDSKSLVTEEGSDIPVEDVEPVDTAPTD